MIDSYSCNVTPSISGASKSFWDDRKGATPNLELSNFKDIVKQIVDIEVIDPAWSKSGLIFKLGLLIHCHFGYFCGKLGKILKN